MKNIFGYSPSPITLKRLAGCLCQLLQLPASKYPHISSTQLARLTGGKPSRLRQDFHHFGGFGQPGHPYEVPVLIEELKRIFGLERRINLLICGAGSMAETILSYKTLKDLDIKVTGVFDFAVKRQGKRCAGLKVMSAAQAGDFLKSNPAHIGVICGSEVERAVDFFNANGIKFIWNLSLADAPAPKGMMVHNANLLAGLLTLIYKINDT